MKRVGEEEEEEEDEEEDKWSVLDQVPTTSHLVIIDAFTFIGLWKKANIDCYVDLNHFDVFYMMFV
jgi:hypothetical protein